MARRYDSSTTTFSPEGRLHQVEYAIEAINNAGTSVGILAKDGVVMASERKITSGLLAPAKVSETLPLFSLLILCCAVLSFYGVVMMSTRRRLDSFQSPPHRINISLHFSQLNNYI